MNTAKVQQSMDEARATQGDAFTALSATADKIVKEHQIRRRPFKRNC